MENIFFNKHDLKYCGNNVIIGKTVRIRRPQDVIIGDNVIIDDFAYIPCALEIGSYTHIGASCSMIGGIGKITIGSFVNISPSCQIITVSNDYKGGGLVGPAIPAQFAGEAITEPVTISDFALLGCNTTVLPGSVIPEGMSTGAFTLVQNKKYEPWCLYVGIPAKFHGLRDGSAIKASARYLSRSERERERERETARRRISDKYKYDAELYRIYYSCHSVREAA